MKLGEQWVEVIDGQEHMLKAVETTVHPPCGLCVYRHGYQCTYPSALGECGKYAVKDLGILKDGLLPCPFCGEYPIVKRHESHFEDEGVKFYIQHVHYPALLYDTEQQAIDAWNRRA